jgi:hypothetical protein
MGTQLDIHREPTQLMATELPAGAQKQLDDIQARLLECLVAGAQDHTDAHSEFMRYGISEGGEVLSAQPAIEHPDHVITRMYSAMFDRAKQEGVALREIATNFRRTPGAPWTFETRWITVDEFARFTESVRPIVEELRVALRRVGRAERQDWDVVSFNLERVLVMNRDRERTLLEPSVELRNFVARVEAVAQTQGLEYLGAAWRVESHMADVESGIDSSIHVI